MLTLAERRFDAGAVTLNYAEGPAGGPPLLFLHGGAGRWQAGQALLAELAPRWHVLAPDLRGHGGSGRVPGGYRLVDYVPDVAALVRATAAGPAAVVGHSLGGHVGLLLAARHPDLVSRLVVGDAPPVAGHAVPAHAPAVRASLARFRELAAAGLPAAEIGRVLAGQPGADTTGTARPGWAARRAENLASVDPEVLETVLDADRMNAGYDAAAVLPAVRCPVLLLQADPAAGGLTSDDEVAAARALLPAATHAFLAGVGHSWLEEERARRQVVDFLAAG